MSEAVENRNRTVLEAALAVACEQGWPRLTRDAVAARAGVAAGSVNNAYGDMPALRDAVMAAAIAECGDLESEPVSPRSGERYGQLLAVVGQGIVTGMPAARAAPDGMKQRALAALAAAA